MYPVTRPLAILLISLFLSACATPGGEHAAASAAPAQGAEARPANEPAKDDVIEARVGKAQRPVDKLLQQGYRKLTAGQLAEAEEIFLRARAEEPENPWVALNLGVVYHLQLRLERAAEIYRQTMRHDTGEHTAVLSTSAVFEQATAGNIARHNLALLQRKGAQNPVAATVAAAGATANPCPEINRTIASRTEQDGSAAGCPRPVADIRFPFKQATPTPEGMEVLNNLLATVDKAKAIELKGFTDQLGPKAYNDRLAQRRAAYVKHWLKAHGIKARLTASGKGLCCFLEAGRDETARAINRRVEVRYRQ